MPRKTRQNKITSPEKTALINKENLRLKNDFVDYLRSTQRSEGTIAGYDNDLLIVFTFILENLNNKAFQNLTKRDIVALQSWLISNGNSPARIRRVKAAVSSLSNYCENVLSDDEPEFSGYRSIVRKIESPPLRAVREKTVWEPEEVTALLGELTESGEYKKACVLALAAYSGRRKAELCRFKVSDFDDDKLVCDGALYKSAPIKTKGRAGGKFLCCYTLAKLFKPYLDAWLTERERLGIQSEWLFPDSSDASLQISESTLSSWANTFSRLSGRDFYFHSMRHAFTTMLARAGIPDNAITQIVGWDSADMCKIYTDIDADDQIGMYFKNGDICVESKSVNDL